MWSARAAENVQCAPDSSSTYNYNQARTYNQDLLTYNQDLEKAIHNSIFWCKTAHTDTEDPQMDHKKHLHNKLGYSK